MSVKIRLSRIGNKKKPFYRIIIANSKSPRDGKFIEKIGYYNPLKKNNNNKKYKIFKKRIMYWMKIGAKPTKIINKIIKKEINVDI